ncbi:hypothetical protein OAH18_00535 [bacterium]|nr:hypothetical protein [bacterium]
MAVSTQQPIVRGQVYRLKAFYETVNLGRAGFSKAREEAETLGIRLVVKVHNRAFVRSDAWIDYLEAQVEASESEAVLA